MLDLLTILGARIVDAAVAASLVSGILALAMMVTRQPSRRRALARAGIVGTLLVIPLVCFRPFAPLDLLDPVRLALEPWLETGPSGWPSWTNQLVRAVPLVLLAVYVAGVAFGIGRIALGSFGAAWIGRNSDAPSDEARTIYDALPSPPGRKKPALRVSSRTTRPVLLGTFRPTILIPPELDCEGSSEALRLALLHEMAHAEASDPWFGLATELASAFWFWLPPLRWIGRQMRLDQEFLADRRASDRLGPSSAKYASTLVEIAAARDTPRAEVGPVPSAGSALLQRVLMLVRCPFPVEVAPPRWWLTLLGVATSVVLLLATGLTLRARAHHGPGPTPATEIREVRIPNLTLDAKGPSPTTTTLPLRLPADFELGFEVLATGHELAQIEVLGHPLASEETPHVTPLDHVIRPHRVVFQRRGGALSIGLDGGPILVLPGTSIDEWLTARGLPETPTVLHSIHLSW
jgi:beta-lactamase regulating signal transducer with metallopeptidase domain